MNLKNVLKNSWKALPIVSLYNIGNDSVKSTFGKLLGHLLYASIPLVYLVGSTISGTPNPLGWREAIEERQEYNQLYDKAAECVEKDGVEGLSLNEVGELYSRAGINFKVPEMRDFKKGFNFRGNLRYGNFYRPSAAFDGPELKKAHLEKIAESCESEGKLE